MDETFYFALVLILVLVIIVILTWHVCSGRSPTNVFRQYLYFDNNGTTPLNTSAANTWRRSAWLGNASASYAQEAQQVIKDTTTVIQNGIGCNYPVIYTSGASESNNLVLRGMTDAYWLKYGSSPHIILSAIEHKTSLECASLLKQQGRATVTLIAPKADGSIAADDVIAAIQPNTFLVSIMHANNETGVINDIETIASRVKAAAGGEVYFHSDVVQTFGKAPLPMKEWKIDAISVSMHKIYGPMGIGFLVMTPAAADMLTPQIAGSQNHHLRGGTENIPSIAATKTALESAWQDRCYKNNRLGAMKMYIQHELQKAFDFGHFNDYVGREDNYSPPGRGIEVIPVGTAASLPNTMLFSFVKRGPLAEHFCNVRLKNDLMRAGIVVSIGSACNTANPSPSHVLSAMKAPYVIRCGVVRISLGDQNTFDECRILVQKIIAAVQAQA